MARSNKRITKKKVSSKSQRRKANAKLGYGQTNKNINTLRKIQKVQQEEKMVFFDPEWIQDTEE